MININADEDISVSDMEAAGTILIDIINGSFYDKQERAHQWLINRPGKEDRLNITRRICEGR